MTQFIVHRSLFLVPRWWFMVRSLLLLLVCLFVVHAPVVGEEPSTKNKEPGTKNEPFRPEAGKFPPADKAKAYQGQLVFVDHANPPCPNTTFNPVPSA
ncbi:MAG: hypothetical protein EA424_00250 [Planctomycetaceae bacterium]|nr:MAG: hypothetical protein EA424_00250 [Planctomycetaceae bacterium]